MYRNWKLLDIHSHKADFSRIRSRLTLQFINTLDIEDLIKRWNERNTSNAINSSLEKFDASYGSNDLLFPQIFIPVSRADFAYLEFISIGHRCKIEYKMHKPSHPSR